MSNTCFRIGTIVALQSEIEKVAQRKHALKFEPLPLPHFSPREEWSYLVVLDLLESCISSRFITATDNQNLQRSGQPGILAVRMRRLC